MNEIEQQVDQIEVLAKKLVAQLSKARKEIEVLKEENLRLKSDREALGQQLLEMEISKAANELGAGLTKDIGSESAGKKLNELIREIDKCILMLDE